MTAPPVRCLIVEDSPVSRAALEGYVAIHSRLELGEESGLAVARRLGPEVPLIVPTDNEAYALDSAQHRAADFLLKPFGFPRFVEAVDRARRLAGC